MDALLRLSLLALLVASPLGVAWADSIHLKNGTTISANTVAEKGDAVEYSIGGTRYSVPKASVASVEHSSQFGISIGTSKSGLIAPPKEPAGITSPTGSRPKVSHSQLATALPKAPPVHGVDMQALYAQVVSYGRVNDRMLFDIEAEGSGTRAAAAYFIAAQYSFEHGDGEAARRYMRRCVELDPEQPVLHEWNAVLLLDGGQYPEAVSEAQQAMAKAPHSAEALQVAGLAYYDSGRFAEAIETWEKAQKISASELVAAYLEKAQREVAVEGGFNQREGSHFVLRYEGRDTSFRFASELLATLDRQYLELQRELEFAPGSTITVILYTQQQFYDVTRAPQWSGALNDGKLRIPVQDLTGVTPELQSVLKHELTHSFVHFLTHGRCPHWLNEGLAQMEEPRSSSEFATPLAEMFEAGKQAPLRVLEGSFMRFNADQAQVAYAESLAVTEYLRSNFGMNAVRRLLDLMADGTSPEAALVQVTQSDYARLERGVGAYLAKNAR